MDDKKTVLIAPLDWGLGHATRCIPIINELLQNNFHVIIAADGAISSLLAMEFPQIKFIFLKGYRVQYSKTKQGLFFKLLQQVPRILRTIKNEHRWLDNVIREFKIDAVISDNRYGLYHKKVRCVFITHQLIIKTPIFQNAVQRLNYTFINRFNECWVPDVESEPSLAGILSHPANKPKIPLHYIGTLSRFKSNHRQPMEKHILILLSGPEPQRTILENILIGQLPVIDQPVIVVRGLPGTNEVLKNFGQVQFVNHLPAENLQSAIQQAFIVISRAGYSTVMDLIKLNKKSILIPTPGQTEQQYIGFHLASNHLAFCVQQEGFRLREILQKANQFPFRFLNLEEDKKLQALILQLKENVGDIN